MVVTNNIIAKTNNQELLIRREKESGVLSSRLHDSPSTSLVFQDRLGDVERRREIHSPVNLYDNMSKCSKFKDFRTRTVSSWESISCYPWPVTNQGLTDDL